MLKPFYSYRSIEAGCDEAGRGCLAGPVFAAAVILPKGFRNPQLNDSKQLSASKRDKLRSIIESEAISFFVASVSPQEIDKINILNASILAMHRAIEGLKETPSLLLIDGNRFKSYGAIPHKCIVKGDAIYASIAAASVLAKTHRDEFMERAHEEFPQFDWKNNKGYPTAKHRAAIAQIGTTPLHRFTFNLQK